MKYLYLTLLYRPVLNLLVFFYNSVAHQDLGIAIILVTLAIRLILFPIFQAITRQQVIMQELQPKLQKIREQHKDDLEQQSLATMALFQEHKVNPFSSFFLTFIQLPILIALYQILRHIFETSIFENLYKFVSNPGTLHTTLLGLLNLQNRSILLVGLAAALTFVQTRLMLPKPAPGETPSQAMRMGAQMAFIGPLVILFIFSNLPAALSLYLLTTTIFSIAQQALIQRKLHHEKLERIRNGAGSQAGV